MKRYKITGESASFHSGVLELTDMQATARKHALDFRNALAIAPGVTSLYKVLYPVQFKCGEVVGYNGEVSKLLATELEVCGEKVSVDEIPPAPVEPSSPPINVNINVDNMISSENLEEIVEEQIIPLINDAADKSKTKPKRGRPKRK